MMGHTIFEKNPNLVKETAEKSESFIIENHWSAWQAVNNFSSKPRTQGSSIFFNWDSLRAKLKSHHEAWSY